MGLILHQPFNVRVECSVVPDNYLHYGLTDRLTVVTTSNERERGEGLISIYLKCERCYYLFLALALGYIRNLFGRIYRQ